MENKEHSLGFEIVTKENLPLILSGIATEREKKGTSEVLIPRIRRIRQEAEKIGEHSTVLQLFQEEFLSAQHILMEEKAKGFRANLLRIAKGANIMQSSTRAMIEYAKENSEKLDPAIKARVYRFTGRFADYKGQYRRSEECYKKGLEFFEQSTKIEERSNILELKGFLSFSLIKQCKTTEGIHLVKETLKEFDESKEGVWLKENNYYAWAVWKSGIEIRTAEHLTKSRMFNHAELIGEFINDAENILVMPDGDSEIFGLRLEELASVKALRTSKPK